MNMMSLNMMPMQMMSMHMPLNMMHMQMSPLDNLMGSLLGSLINPLLTSNNMNFQQISSLNNLNNPENFLYIVYE
jgi:hypothetical protein